MNTNLAVRVLGALAHDSRLAIFRALVVAGPSGLPAGEIAQKLAIAPSSLSFHLKELSHADLVSGRQEGRFVYYSANFEAMGGLIGFLTENCCAGDTSGAAAAFPRCIDTK
jgi:ArsR family transcriptional regulator, arsenate/arsenite/antimonite-responsive transcriptional repressor